jgi:hypothetical protein
MFYRLLAINAVPCLLSGVIWWTQRKHWDRLTSWRRAVFITALVVNTVASVSFCVLIAWLAFGEGRPIGRVVEDRLFLSMIGLGLLSTVLAAFGRGLPRGLLIANGALVALQWWLLAATGV